MNSTSAAAHDTTTTGPLKQAIPARHGADMAASRRMVARLRRLILADPEPDEAAWQAMGDALWRGDPLADRLVTWMHAEGVAHAWPQFEHALHTLRGDPPSAQGSASAERPTKPATPLDDFMAATRAWPAWVDANKMLKGAQMLQSTGLHGMMVLRDAGLMTGYQASAINQTLVMTGALHTGAQRRVAATTAWWLACTEDGGMWPGSEGFTQTLRVRVVHAMVRRQLLAKDTWDAAYLGTPINQLDMQATYLAFSVVQLLALKTTGVWVSAAESDAVMHLWRYIGWLMGVEEGLLCHDEQQGRICLYQNVLSQAPPDASSALLGRALMDEPLQRHYPHAGRWRGAINKARHLSLVRWFVGADGMDKLGLPQTLPWYPLLMMPPLACRSALMRLVPGLMPRVTRRARQRQRAYLAVLQGGAASDG